MTTVHAYAALTAGRVLEPFEYELPEIAGDQVDIEVAACGICHSDLSVLNSDWGRSRYPLVPGHEVAGTVAAVGPTVKHLRVGDRVGLGWQGGYCMTCPTCLDGDHNLCAKAEPTIIGRHGGFADRVRARAASVVKIPSAIDLADAGPLFCGGITVFNPLVQYGVSPLARVGVIGIGGLGHLALKFLRAWGCEVTAFTSSPAKRDEALKLGAHDTLDSRDGLALRKAAGRFDLLIATVNVKLDWNAYLATLRPKGRLHLVGATLEPLDIGVFALLGGQRSVSGSPVGSPATIARMLDFAVRHNIRPVVQTMPMGQVNDALELLHAGQAHYRLVLTR
jgi:alcohol/geraniol dehydrogenase (NADP+)